MAMVPILARRLGQLQQGGMLLALLKEALGKSAGLQGSALSAAISCR